MLVLCHGGQRWCLALIRPQLLTARLGLFVNDWDPAPDSVIGDILEASYNGYARQTVSDWSAVFTNLLGQAETDAGSYLFAVTAPSSPQSAYGYFVVNSSGDLLWAERNTAGPQPMDSTGQSYVVLPRFALTNLP